MLTAGDTRIVAIPGAVMAPAVVIIDSVPFLGGISRTLRSGRGSKSDQGSPGTTALAGCASTGCLAWVADHPQLELFSRSHAGILFLGVVLVHNGASIKFFLAGQIFFRSPPPWPRPPPLQQGTPARLPALMEATWRALGGSVAFCVSLKFT
jgi:hypothetical protein